MDIEVAAEDDVKKCVSTYSGSKWKGFTLSVQEARPSFMQRLQEEREKVTELRLNSELTRTDQRD